MSVYIDEAYFPIGSVKMCHLIADSEKELHKFVALLGIDKRFYKVSSITPWRNHYELSVTQRRLAVKHGAIEVTNSQMGRLLKIKRLAVTEDKKQ